MAEGGGGAGRGGGVEWHFGEGLAVGRWGLSVAAPTVEQRAQGVQGMGHHRQC